MMTTTTQSQDSTVCQQCAKVCKNTQGLKVHMRSCKIVAPIITQEAEVAIQIIEIQEELAIELVESQNICDDTSDLESVDFNMSEQSVIDSQSTETITCHKCLHSVSNLTNAHVYCEQCVVVKPVNTIAINQIFNKSNDLLNGEICDLKPVMLFGKLNVYAPTTENTRRLIQIETIKYQSLESVIDMPVETYKQTTWHIKSLYEQTDKEVSSLSLYKDKSLDYDQIIALYQGNPTVGESKQFTQKLLLDNSTVTFKINKQTTIYVDIETSCCDNDYFNIPQPDNADHKITIIQALIVGSDGIKNQYILHQDGYQYDKLALNQEFEDVNIIFIQFVGEREMVDYFWNLLIQIKEMSIFTGFNACHKILYSQSKGTKFEIPKQFCGYDLKWLTSRTSYRFTPNNNIITVEQGMTTVVSSIKELPNIVMVDYQGLVIKKMQQKEKNVCEGNSLKQLFQALYGNETINNITKLDQNIIDLQRVCHQQMNKGADRVDMTDIMRYSINDTVCLFRSEEKMGFLLSEIQYKMELSNIGMSNACSFTANALNILEIGRMRLNNGLGYKIVPISHQDCKITGAYTNNEQCYKNTISKNVNQDDFASLYPSVIINFNISPDSLITITNNIESYSSESFGIVDISDDNKFNKLDERTYAVYDKTKQSIYSQLCSNLTTKRASYKQQMEQYEKSSSSYKKFEQLQSLVKVQNNAIYGGSGSVANPYYQYEIACSITAGARWSLSQLNRSVHELCCFIGDVKLQQQDLMCKTIIKDVQTWTRNMFNKQDDSTSRICQNDTDSAFYICDDLPWFKQALSDPVNQASLYKQFRSELQAIAKIHLNNSDILQFSADEFILALLTSSAKKSYIRLDVVSSKDVKFYEQYATVINNISSMIDGVRVFNIEAVNEHILSGKLQLTIKGVQWSLFDKYMRNRIRQLFLAIILTGNIDRNVSETKQEIMSDYQDSMTKYINGDSQGFDLIQRFAKRVKTSGKSSMIKYLKTNYKFNDTFTHILPLKKVLKGQKQSELVIPLYAITKANRHMIDDQAVFNTFQSQIKKFFNGDQKQAIEERNELLGQMNEDQVMIRLETNKNKQSGHLLQTAEELEQFVINNTKFCVHEVIHSQMNKLYFDIDGTKIDLHEFNIKVKRELQRATIQINDLQMFVSQRKDTQEKHSYHITFNIVMPLEITFIIAQRLKNRFNGVDLQVYALNKTLRVNNTYKLNKQGHSILQSVLTSDCQYKDTLVTYIKDYQTVEIPICLLKQDVISFVNGIQLSEISNQNLPVEYISLLEKITVNQSDYQAQSFYKRASLKAGIICPACLKLHDEKDDEKLSLYQTQTQYVLKCFRARQTGEQSRYDIQLTKEQKKLLKEASKDMDIDVTQQFTNQHLSTQRQKYVEFDINSDLIFVKSGMGSNKTGQTILALKKWLIDSNAVMLSVRQTLSTEWVSRYRNSDIKMIDYRDVIGHLQVVKQAVTVIQVDSLCRLQTDQVGLLILDEVQSIIAQLNSSQLRDKTAVQTRFIQLIRDADKVICLDANLHDTTITLIQSIRSQTGHFVFNDFKHYTDYNTTIRKFKKAGIDHLLNDFKRAVIDENKNVIGHINSRDILFKVATFLQKQKPDLKIKLYHGDDKLVEWCDICRTKKCCVYPVKCAEHQDCNDCCYHKDIKLRELKDVGSIWSQQQVVLYTGSISAGVDFSLEHFHENISVFTQKANSADQFVQGLMRCRKLIDKKITIYAQTTDKQFNVKISSVYEQYIKNMSTFNVSSNQITDDLFNLQIYLNAYDLQQEARSIDILVSSFNQMGMNIIYDKLSNADMTCKTTSKTIEIKTSHITKEFLQKALPIVEQSSEYYINKNNQIKSDQIMSRELNAQLNDDLMVITYFATINHDQLTNNNAFCDQKILTNQINGYLTSAKQNENLQEQITEFNQYVIYRDNFRVFTVKDIQIVDMSEQQLQSHISVILSTHNNQYKDQQRIKNSKIQDLNISKDAVKLLQAYKFYQSFKIDSSSMETQNLAKECGQSKVENYKHILVKLGLSLIRESKQVRINGKRERSYITTIKPFFSNTIVLELQN